MSFSSLEKESCLRHLGLTGKGVVLLETGTHDLSATLCLLCAPAKLSPTLQVTSESRPLHRDFLLGFSVPQRIANSFYSPIP